MKPLAAHRPRLALPFTVIQEPHIVRLVAGEDFRYTLNGPHLDNWLPSLLARCNGRTPVADLLQAVEEPLRTDAYQLIERLYGERILVDGIASDRHPATAYHIEITGDGRLRDALARAQVGQHPGTIAMPVLCQDRLDYYEILHFNQRALNGASPWLWASIGAMSRGFVGPVCVPDAGPCLACLMTQFQRLSPAPDIYDALIAHAERGGSITPAVFPVDAIEMLARLVLWKVASLLHKEPPASLYRLHVLEVDAMTVTSHRVLVDPECPQCGRGA